MSGILQSGQVTPGHLARFVTDGVIADGGADPYNVIAVLKNANFSVNSDQPIIIPFAISAFQLLGITITHASSSLTIAVGGFYPQSSKGGTPIVAASQTYSALTTPASLLSATVASFGLTTRFSAANLGNIGGLLAIWFSLTTPQTPPGVTADIYIRGVNLS